MYSSLLDLLLQSQFFFFLVSPKGVVFKNEKNPTFPEQAHVIGSTAGIYCSLQQENFDSQQMYSPVAIRILIRNYDCHSFSYYTAETSYYVTQKRHRQ